MRFCESYICSNLLDVQESFCCFAQFNRMPALELWDLIVSVFGSVIQTFDRTGRPVDIEKKKQKSHGKIDVLENIDICSL